MSMNSMIAKVAVQGSEGTKGFFFPDMSFAWFWVKGMVNCAYEFLDIQIQHTRHLGLDIDQVSWYHITDKQLSKRPVVWVTPKLQVVQVKSINTQATFIALIG